MLLDKIRNKLNEAMKSSEKPTVLAIRNVLERIKKIEVEIAFCIFFAWELILLLFFDTKPKNSKLFVGSPDNWSEDNIDDGPGIVVMYKFFLI